MGLKQEVLGQYGSGFDIKNIYIEEKKFTCSSGGEMKEINRYTIYRI